MAKRSFSQKSELIYNLHHFALDPDTREVFLDGFIDDEIECAIINSKSASIFLKNLQYLISSDATKPIFIHLSSNGGDWHSGMIIYDAISNCPVHVTMIVHGHAFSMGGIILQAADTRIMMPHADLLIHEGSMYIEGTYKNAESNIELCKKTNKIMLDIFSDRCSSGIFFKDYKLTGIRKYIQSRMDRKQDWYLDAEETVKYGFADTILGQKPEFKDIYTIINKNGV